MTKEWSNKDKYHPFNGVLEPRVHMPRAKTIVRTVLVWGKRKVAGGVAGRATPVRPVHHTGETSASLDRQRAIFRGREDARFGSGGFCSGGWYEKSAGGQFARRSPPRAKTGMGGVVALRWRGGTVHKLPFVVFVLLNLERVGSLIVVTVVVLVEVALIGEMLWIVLTPLWSKWLDTSLLF
jgi:hypothetical protein